jgi:uncharacterized membrane protein YphA (DoxX/SURF4 family)
MSFVYGLGRFLFGSFFVYNGINHLTHTEQLEEYAAAKQQPYPHLQVKASGALLVAAGASLALGIKPRIGALGLLTFLATVTPTMHDFWNQEDAGQQQNEMIHFSKNVALAGAALAFAGAPEDSDE